MNEAETRAERIDPMLKACGWGVAEGSRILREYSITAGRILSGGGRGKKLTADYILMYKGLKLAAVEAKSENLPVGEGVMQAKLYAGMLHLETTYSTNGHEIYQICMKTGEEGLVQRFLSPDEMWERTFPPALPQAETPHNQNTDLWRERFAGIPFEDKGGAWQLRYYQEAAISKTMEAIAKGRERILLTLATGTGKTAIAFQIAWKLFQTRWNLSAKKQPETSFSRRPRILFLADRNILADQAYNAFSAFPEDAMVRIKPDEISRTGRVPTNGSIFFTIFQTFMTETYQPASATQNPQPSKAAEGGQVYQKAGFNFWQYPDDFFDFIIIDECHRGGANDESNWRAILEYFNPAVQLGLTATPKRSDNVDTYKYFGEPVYIYSLKEGINDGFLTPFKVKRVKTTLDDYRYTSDDTVLEGIIDPEKLYEEKDFNRNIEIVEREAKRVKVFLDNCNQKEKSLLFCASQAHAALIRDLVNQYAKSKDPFYCVRVTANDGEEGERQLREFQDNEKTIPTLLTTSHKLSTGVDARNIRNIVLLRPINTIIEFKQIVGRGTRLFEGKEFFTIYDFVDAYKLFSDAEWDGEPEAEETCLICGQNPCQCVSGPAVPCPVCGQRPCICEKLGPEPCVVCGKRPCICRKKVKVKLGRGKEREISHIISTSFWSTDGHPITADEFLHNLFGVLPTIFRDEDELRQLWSNPATRKVLLAKLDAAGYPKSDLLTLQKLVEMEKSDLYDVLEYVFNGDHTALTRAERARDAEAGIQTLLNLKQREFINFVLAKYVESGIDELDQDKLPDLLKNKYDTLEDAKAVLGDERLISELFTGFQKYLYNQRVA